MVKSLMPLVLLFLLPWNCYGAERQRRFLPNLLPQVLPKVLPKQPPQTAETAEVSFCQGSCPTGWVSFNDRCFQYFAITKEWIDAELHCLSLGGNLASVHSEEEFNFIKALIKSKNPAETPAWVGLTDCPKNNVWLWTDGSKVDFTKWTTGEPNDVAGGEQCVHTNWSAQKGWNDIPCKYSYAFICSLRSDF